MVAIYTGTEVGTCLAWSNDGGRTWHDYLRNPVANPTNGGEIRLLSMELHQVARAWPKPERS